MNWLDIILILVLAFALVQGLRTGLVRSLIRLAGLVLGLWLAARLYPSVGGWLHGFVSNEGLANVLGFALVLVAVVIVASIIGSIVGGIISAVGLGLFDRLGGAALSLVVTAIVIGGVLAVLVKYSGSAGLEETIRGSAVARVLLDRVPLVLRLMPGEFDSVRRFFL